MNCREFNVLDSDVHYIYTFFVDNEDSRKILFQFNHKEIQYNVKKKVSDIDDKNRKILFLLLDKLIEDSKQKEDTKKEIKVKNNRKCLEELFEKYPSCFSLTHPTEKYTYCFFDSDCEESEVLYKTSKEKKMTKLTLSQIPNDTRKTLLLICKNTKFAIGNSETYYKCLKALFDEYTD